MQGHRELVSIMASSSPLNFANQALRNRSFKGQNLNGADFSGCDIRGCSLILAVREIRGVCGTSFRGADLTNAKFDGARLQKTDFAGAVIERQDRFDG